MSLFEQISNIHQSPGTSGMEKWLTNFLCLRISQRVSVQRWSSETCSFNSFPAVLMSRSFFHSTTDGVHLICKCPGHRAVEKTGMAPAFLQFIIQWRRQILNHYTTNCFNYNCDRHLKRRDSRCCQNILNLTSKAFLPRKYVGFLQK